MLRRFRPEPEPEMPAASPQMERQRMENVSQLSNLIKENPEVFAQIVRSWSGAEEDDSSSNRQAA